MAVEDRDLGYTHIIQSLEDLGGTVEVGVFANAGTDDDGKTSLADVAIWNEYGTEHIPARPFVRKTVDRNAKKWDKTAAQLTGKVIDGMSADQALELLGEEAKKDMRNMITYGSFAPNAPATIAKKKSSHPLIDSGALRNRGVNYRVKKGD